MMAISMMAFIVEERTRRELSFTTPRDWTLSYIRDLTGVLSVFAVKRNLYRV